MSSVDFTQIKVASQTIITSSGNSNSNLVGLKLMKVSYFKALSTFTFTLV